MQGYPGFTSAPVRGIIRRCPEEDIVRNSQKWPLVMASTVSMLALAAGLTDMMVSAAENIGTNAAANAAANNPQPLLQFDQQRYDGERAVETQIFNSAQYPVTILGPGAQVSCVRVDRKWNEQDTEQDMPNVLTLHVFGAYNSCNNQVTADIEATEESDQ